MNRQTGTGAIISVMLLGLLWGLNWPAVKFLLTEIPPLTIRAVAFPLAALLLAIAAKATGQSLRIAPREILPTAITGFFVIFGFNILTALGQVMVQTSRAAIIAYTMPALTAVLASIALGERISTRLLAALMVGMSGLAVLASEDLDALIAEPLGPLIMFLAALSWAIGNVALKARRWTLSPLALTVWFFVISSVLSWLLVLVFEPVGERHWPSAPVLWTLLYHVLGPMVVCYLMWTVLLGRLPATVAAIATLTAPVVGVLSAIVLLGDPPTWHKLTALVLVVASIAMTLAPRRQ